MLRDQAQDNPELLTRGAALMVIAWSLLETGQWDDALEYGGRARTLAAIYHEPVVLASVMTAGAYIAACRGHSATAAEDAMSVLGVSGLAARSSMAARANHAMGMAALVEDRNDEAFDWLRQLVADDGRAAHNREALFGLIDLAEAGRRTGRQAEASRLVEGALDRSAGRAVPAAAPGPRTRPGPVCRRSSSRGALPGGAQRNRRRPRALRARPRAPELRPVATTGTAPQGRPVAPNAAAHVFRLLAATPWLKAATHELRAAGVRSGSSPVDALSSLSPSERQVVLLAAEGLTNPEIAARLFVSPRTVGAHLYRSFAKLGVSNRTQLTALARQNFS